ncbi:MAG: DUF3179 domain-containing protein [Gammaproteobacteria bacterium]|jgi:hypothetical protein|nr:DUF3179 domain-containing protein [Gammaproteobacteria bacterium]MDH3751393.1 DUF3179 domain-containing protein [Gammaproteobacteria bacterium]MDH3803933.1 DUF3179 domain-containing protein [Gammaproteobacteria bacterium]
MPTRYFASRPVALQVVALFLIAACGGGGGGGGGNNNNPGTSGWLIPEAQVVDAGPGQDGIPAVDRPIMQLASTVPVDDILRNELVVGVLHEGTIHAYPHNIMNWHEVVNDSINFNDYVLSYCPLTGSAVAWDVDDNLVDTEFGVSGLLYNSNLILYDRESGSRWSQMLEQSVQGPRAADRPERIQVIETTWATWQAMYPDSFVLTRDTGFDRDYTAYPYGAYRFSDELLFPVSNTDNRLHPKERVIGIHSGATSKVYQIGSFGAATQTVNDQFGGTPIVVVGDSGADIAAIYSRELADGTILTFSPLDDQLPNIMDDTEGNVWDVFGNAVSGPRTGERLAMTNSYTAMWFAWVAFYPGAEIHFN